MTDSEIQILVSALREGDLIFWNNGDDLFRKVTKIISGEKACPEEPEIAECAVLLADNFLYVSLFDAEFENFIIG